MKNISSRKEYVENYFTNNYGNGWVDDEIEAVGKFLAKNVTGKALDCGCGPVPQVWAICMPLATELHAIDLAPESIPFIKKELKNKKIYAKIFVDYKKIVEKTSGKLPINYISKQIDKIKSVQNADMSKKLPFPDNCFDTVMCLYSLWVLKDESELYAAIKEISRVLKKGWKLLHINTNGQNRNDILPEYTYRGLSQTSDILIPYLKKTNFKNISLKELKLKWDRSSSMYKYNKISFLLATKK